jgi:hypothetical protein
MFEWDEVKRLKTLKDRDLVFDGRPVLHFAVVAQQREPLCFCRRNKWRPLHGRLDLARRQPADYFFQEGAQCGKKSIL